VGEAGNDKFMSDARDKLSAAIAAKKSGPASKPSAPKKAKATAVSSSPAPPARTSRPKAEKEKAKKKSGGGGNLLGNALGKLAKNFVEGLKDATGEISPKQLIESARDGISNLQPGEKEGGIDEAPVPTSESPLKSPLLHATSASPPKAPLQIRQTVPPRGMKRPATGHPPRSSAPPRSEQRKKLPKRPLLQSTQRM
tara:strand:- start:2448 stop:3038 length:591 start_codon:yes stop_codon:yes gene_type:complete